MNGLDRSLVTVGLPIMEGLHFLWSDHQGWPVLDVVHVQVKDGVVTWWRGIGGTNRPVEVPGMFGFSPNQYLGSSRITPEVVAHYDELWGRTAAAVNAMLDKLPP